LSVSRAVCDDVAEAARPRPRLRPLLPHDGPLGLAVREVELDQARRHQHPAHEDEEDHHVLAEQAPAAGGPGHRRKASARSMIFRGTVRPRSSAVLRFTARSIFSAPSTGTSLGGAPRRILATSVAAWTPSA